MNRFISKELEHQVVKEVSSDTLWKHLNNIIAEERLPGSKGEARAVNYFKRVMQGFGLEVKIHEFESFTSLPISATATVLSPQKRTLGCITHSFSVTTPPGGLEGALVYSTSKSNEDIEGKFVLCEGLASPALCLSFEQRGAIGIIMINSGDLPTNMIISTVWGQPTPETAQHLPKVAVVSMAKANGQALKSMLGNGPVGIRLNTEVKTGFWKIPVAVADLEGKVEPEKFVLFGSHIDSWYKGASDNGTGNACILETARILSKYRDHLRRGVRFVWWSGHSHGRYSGSNWYADSNWEDLYNNAVLDLTVDIIGCKGATDYTNLECVAETYHLGKSIIEEYTGQIPRYRRVRRGGDQSFWGIGLPSLFQLLSLQPPEEAGADTLVNGLPWYWHTEADTIDKIDREIFRKDTQIYMAALWRLCTAPVLPYSFAGVADEFKHHMLQLQEKAKGAFDLTPVLEKAAVFREKAEVLEQVCQDVSKKYSASEEIVARQGLELAAKLNKCLMKLSRELMPVNYCSVDRFDADRAYPIGPFKRLHPIADLGDMDRDDAPFKFLERKMVRERNRVCHALDQALEFMAEALGNV
jgi:hypothetical protein